VLFTPIRHQLIFERCCDANPEQRPNFNFNEIAQMFPEESLLEALEPAIGAFKHHQAMVVPTKLQSKTPVQLAEKPGIIPASVIGYFQRRRWTTL
jgi:hypothetical protein